MKKCMLLCQPVPKMDLEVVLGTPSDNDDNIAPHTNQSPVCLPVGACGVEAAAACPLSSSGCDSTSVVSSGPVARSLALDTAPSAAEFSDEAALEGGAKASLSSDGCGVAPASSFGPYLSPSAQSTALVAPPSSDGRGTEGVAGAEGFVYFFEGCSPSGEQRACSVFCLFFMIITW